MIEFAIAGDCAELSLNKRLFYLKRARLNRKWRETASLLYRSNGHGEFAGKVRVSFVLRRGRRLDPHNAMSTGAIKAVLDGLVDAGMVPDDTDQYLEIGSVRQETAKEYRHFPELLVQIEEADAGG